MTLEERLQEALLNAELAQAAIVEVSTNPTRYPCNHLERQQLMLTLRTEHIRWTALARTIKDKIDGLQP